VTPQGRHSWYLSWCDFADVTACI